MSWMMFPAGLLISVLAIFAGLGGGILWTPFLLSIYGLPPQQAVLHALALQVFGQTSATLSNASQGLLRWNLVRQQVLVAVPGAVVGAALSRVLHPAWLQGALGLLTFAIAYVFLRGNDLFVAGGQEPDLAEGRRILPVTLVGGLLTGLLSIGIGDWLVPLLNKRCRLTMAHSVANGIALMLFLSCVATGSHLLFGGRLAPGLIAWGAPGVVLGAQVGSRLHRRVSETRFKELFVLLLIFVASHLLFGAV